MNLPLDLAVAATGATLLERSAAPATLRISTDTRTMQPGDAFLALHGERFDGHEYLAEAVRCGAALLILDRPQARVPGTPAMIVGETLRAYMTLAGAARSLFRGRVVAITGSAGKTTTKSFLADLLAARYRVHAAPGNENNEIGVSKLLLSASNEAHDAIVVEMGARRFGDVAELVAIAAPEVGILTNIGEAHLEIMGSRERLAETKWALFGRGARAVLNAGDAVSRERARGLALAPHWFAALAEDAPAKAEPGERITALLGERRLLDAAGGRAVECDVEVRLPGAHNRANLAAALAGALELDVPLDLLVPKIPDLRLPAGRYDEIALANGVRLIYDAYNANASGTIAALDAFAVESAPRRIAVLAGMAELGDESQALHERVGAHAATRVDVLLL
ncbi:MAG: UDP-N-acetylmuramoyl-tripeptide--D-alanyl-D-alanine ligase, partial [Candidatus Baltobacteraceae bacterium]